MLLRLGYLCRGNIRRPAEALLWPPAAAATTAAAAASTAAAASSATTPAASTAAAASHPGQPSATGLLQSAAVQPSSATHFALGGTMWWRGDVTCREHAGPPPMAATAATTFLCEYGS